MNRTGPSFALVAAVLCLTWATQAAAENIDPNNDGSQYAWGENVGWIIAEQDTDGDGNPDQGVFVEDYLLTGWMWGENIGWISLSCLTTTSCGEAAYSVLNNGSGELTGWAWGENVGWISFSCANTGSCVTSDYGVTIDVSTGRFSGKAWGESIGWISFDFDDPAVRPYQIQAAWNCDPPPAAPAGPPEVFMDEAGPDVRLSWAVLPGATGYDIIQGDLGALRQNGDYAVATESCIRNDLPVTFRVVSGDINPGEGLWYLVRGVNCGNSGFYDTFEDSQVAGRDDEIAASGNGCM